MPVVLHPEPAAVHGSEDAVRRVLQLRLVVEMVPATGEIDEALVEASGAGGCLLAQSQVPIQASISRSYAFGA